MITAIVTLLGGWRATAFAAALLASLAYAGVVRIELSHARNEMAKITAAQAVDRAALAEAAAKAAAKNRETERKLADAVTQASDAYTKGKADAQATASRVAADLRTGAVRLRSQLTACSASRVPQAPAAAQEPDGTADLRNAVARTVAIGADCDARIRSLTDVLNAERN